MHNHHILVVADSSLEIMLIDYYSGLHTYPAQYPRQQEV